MNKSKVLIVDDLDSNIELYKLYLNKYFKNKFQIQTATTILDATQAYLEHHHDILILDVELENNDTIFKMLDSISTQQSQIIFITSHENYAIQAINSVKSSAYLLKPLTSLDFYNAVDKCLNNKWNENNPHAFVDLRHSDLIAIPYYNKIVLLNTKEVIYIESEGRYSIFHLTNGEQRISSKNIGEFEKILNPANFFRVHNSYIVNLNMVSFIYKADGNYCELNNSIKISISKRKQEQFYKHLHLK